MTLVDAMVATSDGLLLLLDGELAVVAVSDTFCRNFDRDRACHQLAQARLPDDRRGRITVDYAGNGPDGSWMLEISDDGVGMPAPGDAPAVAGLGTSIVEALVRQQRAHLTGASSHPGTIVFTEFECAGTVSAEKLPLARAA